MEDVTHASDIRPHKRTAQGEKATALPPFPGYPKVMPRPCLPVRSEAAIRNSTPPEEEKSMTRIKTLLPLVAFAIAAASALPAAAQQEMFLAADKNGDTALDKSEFPAFIDAAAAAGKPMAQKIKAASRYNMAFGRIDKNGDGFISPEELSSLK